MHLQRCLLRFGFLLSFGPVFRLNFGVGFGFGFRLSLSFSLSLSYFALIRFRFGFGLRLVAGLHVVRTLGGFLGGKTIRFTEKIGRKHSLLGVAIGLVAHVAEIIVERATAFQQRVEVLC